MLAAHPYEEVAYDVYPLKNTLNSVGAGIIGDLPKAMPSDEFLRKLKDTFGIPVIRHSYNFV